MTGDSSYTLDSLECCVHGQNVSFLRELAHSYILRYFSRYEAWTFERSSPPNNVTKRFTVVNFKQMF